jgi:hypothetical protein
MFIKRENYHWKSGHLPWVKVEENIRWRALGIERSGKRTWLKENFFCCYMLLVEPKNSEVYK